ncbi:MAG TPA: hypothetical protein VHM28_03720, partial [Anaerolineales bacterium]|nr:hypothetical protein [Anaerolineales bacterium]
MDAMFASHAISNGPKPADEYRIILLGDSAVWGFEVSPQDTVSEQINRLDLQSCDGRRIKAYNLAYPLPSNTRDLVTLQKAMSFQPDLVIWLVTLKTFDTTTAEKDLLIPQSEQVLALINQYHIKVDAEKYLHPRSFFDKTMTGSAVRLKKIVLEQFYGFLLTATGFDTKPPDPHVASSLSENVDAVSNYNAFALSDRQSFIDHLDFSPVSVAGQIVGAVPILVVNEPIFRANGENSDLRYNKYYPRWAYDSYRAKLSGWVLERRYSYLDLWNAIPNDEFVGSPLHLNPEGESKLAHLLSAKVAGIACR